MPPTGDWSTAPAAYRAGAVAQAAALDALRAADAALDWTYLSPAPEIGAGERTGGYRVGADHPVGSWISYADYAVALVDELEKPAHRRTRFTVATR
jgi:putative NADH-flavin reductase